LESVALPSWRTLRRTNCSTKCERHRFCLINKAGVQRHHLRLARRPSPSWWLLGLGSVGHGFLQLLERGVWFCFAVKLGWRRPCLDSCSVAPGDHLVLISSSQLALSGSGGEAGGGGRHDGPAGVQAQARGRGRPPLTFFFNVFS
jgi:hypothetical protein